jgi:hypothetical protein
VKIVNLLERNRIMIVYQTNEYHSSMKSLHDQISTDQEHVPNDDDSRDGDPTNTSGNADSSCHVNLCLPKLSSHDLTRLYQSDTSTESSDSSSCTSTTRGRRRFRKSKPIKQTMNQRMFLAQGIILNMSEVLVHKDSVKSQPFPTNDGSLSSVSVFSYDEY